MPSIEHVGALVREFGWPGAILIVGAVVSWVVLRFLARKFFDDEKGYVPRVVAAHLQFVGAVQTSVEMQQQVGERQLALAEATQREIGEVRKLIESVTVAGKLRERAEHRT